MPTKAESNGNDMRVELAKVMEAIDGVTIHGRGKFDIVKHGSTTLGYLNGKRKVRVGFPMRGGLRPTMLVATEADMAIAVKEMESFIPPLEREAHPDPKPERKPRKSRAKVKSEPVETPAQ